MGGLPGGGGSPLRAGEFTEELLEDDRLAASGMAVEVEHHLVGNLKMARGPRPDGWGLRCAPDRPLQRWGQHTDEILGELGYDEARVRELRDKGITR